MHKEGPSPQPNQDVYPRGLASHTNAGTQTIFNTTGGVVGREWMPTVENSGGHSESTSRASARPVTPRALQDHKDEGSRQ